MSIVERVKDLNLPLDQIVVIAGGVLDALNLRKANDIDLVLTEELLDRLSAGADWDLGTRNGEPILTKGDVEAFLSWGVGVTPNFRQLYDDGITVDGVRFASPQYVIDRKRERLSEKDKADIILLEEYLNHE